jgi:hypothetical protein
MNMYIKKGQAEETARHNLATEANQRIMARINQQRANDPKWAVAVRAAEARLNNDPKTMGLDQATLSTMAFEIANEIYSSPLGRKPVKSQAKPGPTKPAATAPTAGKDWKKVVK